MPECHQEDKAVATGKNLKKKIKKKRKLTLGKKMLIQQS